MRPSETGSDVRVGELHRFPNNPTFIEYDWKVEKFLVGPEKIERVESVAVGGDTVRPGVSDGGRCIPQPVCRKQRAIHVAPRGVVDLRRRVFDSHWV